MSRPVSVKKIACPSYARELEVGVEPDEGELSFQAFAPHLDQVLARIEVLLEAAVNDSQRFFLEESSGFPQRSQITGEYYVAALTYEGDEEMHQLWVRLHCLGKEARQSGPGDPDYNYVSMEMIVYLNQTTGAITYEEGFNSAAI